MLKTKFCSQQAWLKHFLPLKEETSILQQNMTKKSGSQNVRNGEVPLYGTRCLQNNNIKKKVQAYVLSALKYLLC